MYELGKLFHIENMNDVAKFISWLVLDLGIDINPDDPMSGYRDREGKPTFTDGAAEYYQRVMDKAIEVCEHEGCSIYDVCMRVLGLFHYCDKNPALTFFCDNGTMWKQANNDSEYMVFAKVHGGTHDDPALIHSITEVSLYFHDEETDSMVNVDKYDSIDCFEGKQGEFYVPAEDYDKAYQQIYEHDELGIEH